MSRYRKSESRNFAFTAAALLLILGTAYVLNDQNQKLDTLGDELEACRAFKMLGGEEKR